MIEITVDGQVRLQQPGLSKTRFHKIARFAYGEHTKWEFEVSELTPKFRQWCEDVGIEHPEPEICVSDHRYYPFTNNLYSEIRYRLVVRFNNPHDAIVFQLSEWM